MKVLHLCGKDFFGAGRAAYRLHKGLLHVGIGSKMWVGAKRTADDTVVDIHNGKAKKKLTKIYIKLEKLIIKSKAKGSREMFSLGYPAHSIRRKIETEKPDIVHLHWINRGYMNLNELKGIKIPVVITLHDMWWFTGGCHYDEGCGRYVNGCASCPILSEDGEYGLSLKQLSCKREILNNTSPITFIGLSTWMQDCVKQSLIGQDHKIKQIPNGIDVDIFAPMDKQACRNKLNLPNDKKLILFAAVDVLSETRKGYQYLSQALTMLKPEEYELVVIGEQSDANSISGLKTYFPGEINDDQLMIEYMSAVDVAVVPSLQENLSNLIMESLACATPVVAFKIGGNGDMIKHKVNGYLAKHKNIEDLTEGIEFCTKSENNILLSETARQTIVDNFDINEVSKKYIQLYQSLVE
ncbi:glycosyltransferase [Saccharicrinis sp. 156]|uniref:glycosyltransferase n=1 Tax=Saccharicrinis sp. 156 TaxID=3417574 RepID=UPI003D34265E